MVRNLKTVAALSPRWRSRSDGRRWHKHRIASVTEEIVNGKLDSVELASLKGTREIRITISLRLTTYRNTTLPLSIASVSRARYPASPDSHNFDGKASMLENHIPTFEEVVVPHLDAAYNLARWLTRMSTTQRTWSSEACLRALRFFGGFRGGDAVRMAHENRPQYLLYLAACKPAPCRTPRNLTRTFFLLIPALSIRKKLPKTSSTLVRRRWRKLPNEFSRSPHSARTRGMSYREIAEITSACS